MKLTRKTSKSTTSSGQSSMANSAPPTPPSAPPQRRETGSITHRNSFPNPLAPVREASNPKTLETYIFGRGGKQFDVSILSSDGEYAALVGDGKLATFRYAGDDRSRDKFEIAAIHKLGERYKPIASASRTWFAIVAKEKFEIYAFVGGSNADINTPIISHECKDIVAIALATNNSWICVGTAQGDILRWKISSEPEPPYASHALDNTNLQPLPLKKQACMISFSPDNKHFVVGLWDAGQSARVIVFGIESEPNSELMKWTINNLGVKGNHGITGLCFTTTGRIVASTWTQNGYLMEKEIHGTAERTSSPPGTRIQSLAVSPTSGILAYIVKNDIIFLDKQRLVVGRGNLKRTAPKQPRPQTSLAFTPDGMFLRVLDTNGHLSAISPNGK